MRICTIVARNYLAYARVLAESFRAHHPDGQCTVLLIDDRTLEVDDATEPFQVIRPEDLSLDRFEGMAAMYDITELATAVKPWLLEHLLEQDERPITYFDPDIRFYASVEKVEALAAEHGIVLTPHITSPIPEDGKQPGELDLMASGTYNLGFLALSPCERTRELLGWWQRRLRYDCVIDHALGYFVDQRWFDLVPNTFGGAAILGDAGMNAAYWNLHERTVHRDLDGSWLVNGEPLRFYHFSGFDPDQPHLLSKHQTRTRLSEDPELAALCREFAEEVGAHRRPGEQGIPYAWGDLGDGRHWDRRLRRLYREGEREGAFTLSPFDADGTEEFLDWLNEPSPRCASGVSRFWFDVYSERPDIRRDFPDLTSDLPEFHRWIEGFGHEIGDIRGLLPESVQRNATARSNASKQAEPPWGVNVAGFLQSELGIGEAARGLICGLDAARVPLLPVHGSWRPSSRQGHVYTMFDVQSAAFPINIVCVNADVMPQWAKQAGARFFESRYTIGLWWWEVLDFPEQWLDSFDLIDEIWVASQHVADALTPVSTVPVTKVSMPVTLPPVIHRSRAELGLPEDFLFMFLFDHHSVFERKNPLATIEAFKRAFPAGAGASLVIKCINHEHHPEAHERLLLAAAEHPDVRILDHYVSANDKNAMIASADCYVSLHRAEGFGLTLAESMRMGKPVIATRYGGNLDFMDDRNSWLVDCEMVPIGPRSAPYPPDGVWGDADVEQAAGHMREIFADPAAAAQRAALGARRMREAHSPATAGATMHRRLRRIYERRSCRPAAIADVTAPDFAHLEDLLAAGDLAPAGRQNPLRRAFRHLVLRLIKPFTAYQRTVDRALLDALRTLSATARADRLREAERAAGALAELRRQATLAQQLQSELADRRAPAARQPEAAGGDNGHAAQDAVGQIRGR